jgi:hypothetical protein
VVAGRERRRDVVRAGRQGHGRSDEHGLGTSRCVGQWVRDVGRPECRKRDRLALEVDRAVVPEDRRRRDRAGAERLDDGRGVGQDGLLADEIHVISEVSDRVAARGLGRHRHGL